MIKGKKGLSPLIATVVLIAFAVALGAVVMSWGKTYVSNAGLVSPKGCSGVSIGIKEVNGAAQLKVTGSGDSGRIEVILENLGSTNIEGLRTWVLGEEGTFKDESKQTIEPGFPLEKTFSYDYNKYGSIKQISFTPMVATDKSQSLLACPNGKAEYAVK